MPYLQISEKLIIYIQVYLPPKPPLKTLKDYQKDYKKDSCDK